MTLLGRKLAVALPDTVLEERSDLRGKTAKLGTMARACSIYGVDRVDVFRDPTGRGEGHLIKTVLEYLETPQYLRKRLFPLDESLRFAGVLPPLRIPSHRVKIRMEEVRAGDVREGFVEEDGTVDVGLEARAKLRGGAKPGLRVTTVVVSVSPLVVKVVRREEVGEYWGYKVSPCSMGEVLDGRSGVLVATSRLGDSFASQAGRLRSAIGSGKEVRLIFGAPSKGLFEMVPGLRGKVDFVLNLYTEQHTETVRTEEALFAGLGLLDVLLTEKA